MGRDLRHTWEREFEQWLRPFIAVLGHAARRRWAPVYLRGLLAPGERKSIQPLAARVAPGQHEQLHHFVATSRWSTVPVERVLAEQAQHLVGGPGAVLIVDDTTLLKQGHCSVGVAHQYSGAVGKNTNCQCLVSLTLARGEVPVAVALRLFLPKQWTDAPARCARVGVPAERQCSQTKGIIALEELDRVCAAGVTFGTVLADAGYGTSAAFRQALSARGLTWAVGILRLQTVYPADVVVRPPRRAPRGRPPTHPIPTIARATAEHALESLPGAAWRTVTWRRGTKGPLTAACAARRVRIADGPPDARGRHLPGEEVWLVGERRATGERKYYLTNHPADTPLRTLATTIKARWACEQAHQQLKQELGLDHFEGRSWDGLHHHALLAMIAFAFLQHLRLLQATGTRWEPGVPPPRPTLPEVQRQLFRSLLPFPCCPRCDGPLKRRRHPLGKVAK
ncbi:MAG TPA: IS701 family transposase [Chloroflexota bacterium]|nr:IS701 family transposase [Chloroflexota bacterium]